MGLDMYAYTAPQSAITKEVDFDISELPDTEILCHWRRHESLHCWMEALYHAKGGTGEFNCDPVVVTPADLERLESETDIGLDAAFITKARAAISMGLAVIYDGWW